MKHCISKFPSNLLYILLISYGEMVTKAAPVGFPGLIPFLVRLEPPTPEISVRRRALEVAGRVKLLIANNRGDIKSKLDEYVRLLKDEGIIVSTPDEYWEQECRVLAIRKAAGKVINDYISYEGKMIAQGAQKVFHDAYYIHIASNISYFFQELENLVPTTYEDDLICILECALRYRFFERILSYASEQDRFDVSDLERTTAEITTYCKKHLSKNKLSPPRRLRSADRCA